MYELALQIAIVAYVYSNVLTDPGMVLNGFYNLLEKHLITESQGRGEWLFKPIIGCFYCVAGQFALWGYFIAYLPKYNLFDHIFFICFTIFAVHLIHLVYTWKK